MIFGLIALANSLTALDSFLIDDPLSLEIDEISQTLPHDDWWTVGPDDAEVDSYWSNMIFEEPEPSPYSFLPDELSNTYLNEDISEDIFALGNDCSSTFAPSRRIRSRGADDQCFNPQSDANIDDQLIQLVNERIKRQWCSKEPWIGFGNIPVTRLVGTEAVPVEPDISLPVLSVPPIKMFTLPGAVLRKPIPLPSSSGQWDGGMANGWRQSHIPLNSFTTLPTYGAVISSSQEHWKMRYQHL
jgi:hypothetical protein